ncbi:MAG: F0F1 ATP synthase subunit A [Pirellulaceae bacterium]
MRTPTLMNLKVLVPFRIFAERTGVARIVAETREGSFGLLPHRLDCVAALFLFIAAAALGTVIPGYESPTGSLSTTAALALCVFVAVPLFGIEEQGLGNYLKSYAKPTFIMLPFNIISELSRTLALAIRLFGNMMSGAMIIAILLTITPFIFPIIMIVLGLLTGMVQAYIFSILFLRIGFRPRSSPQLGHVAAGPCRS